MKNTNAYSTATNLKSWFYLLLFVAIATLCLHSYLTSQHYNIKLGTSEGSSICNISATFNCDAVAASKYSAVFNIPVALFGFLAQLALVVLLVTAHFSLSESSSAIRRLVFWLSLLIAVVSVIMGFISTMWLGTFCLFCMATYALSFIGLFAAWKFQASNPFAHFTQDVGALFLEIRWVFVLLIAIPAIGWMANAIIMDNYGLSKLNAMVEEEMILWDQSPIIPFTEQGLTSAALASTSTQMTIVEFADFLCPHCKAASPTLDAFVNSHKDVKLIFKAFPLDGKCNKAINHVGDGFRCQLAAAAICAEKINQQGWKAHHWIFEHQEKFMMGYDSDVAMKELATELSLTEKDLKTCINDDKTFDAVQAVAKEGEMAKIEGTPTIFVNGKKLQRGQFLPVLQKLHEKITGN